MFLIVVFMAIYPAFSLFAFNDDLSELQSVRISSPVNYLPQSFDVLNYSALLDFHKAPSKEMTGLNRIKINWVQSPIGNLFYFHLRGLTVDSVKYNGKVAECNVVGKNSSAVYHYEVLPPANAKQDTAIISVYYHGTMTNADDFGGVFSDNGILYSVGVGFRNNYVSTTQHWLACYDHPSDKATFDFSFITPKNLSVASNGIMESETDYIIDNSTYKLTKWTSKHTIATNLMTFAVGNYIKLSIKGSDLPIDVYCLPKDSAACEFVFKKVPEMVQTFKEKYGEYRFDKVGYVITPLSAGAMEHQTMITMNGNEVRRMYGNKDSINSTAAHELSHHWFGNSVTPYDYRDAWFNEGFATFSEAIWQEKNFGYSKYLSSIASRISYYINTATKREGVFSLFDYTRKSPSSNYPITIYYKGAAVAALLRYELGDKVFFGAIKKYLDSLAYGNMNIEKMRAILEKFSGQDLNWFFKQWIYGKGYPIIDVTTYKSKSKTNGLYTARIHISQVQNKDWGIYKNLPVEFVFAGLNGDKVTKILKVNAKDTDFYLDSLPDFYAPLINGGDSLRTLLKLNNVTTAIDEINNNFNLFVFPNPSEDFVSVHIDSKRKISSVKLSDVTGRLIKRYNIRDIYSNNIIRLDVRELNAGLYYLTFESDKIIKTINFIKK